MNAWPAKDVPKCLFKRLRGLAGGAFGEDWRGAHGSKHCPVYQLIRTFDFAYMAVMQLILVLCAEIAMPGHFGGSSD